MNLAENKEPKYYKHIFYHLMQNNWTTYIKSMINLVEDQEPKYYKHIFDHLLQYN